MRTSSWKKRKYYKLIIKLQRILNNLEIVNSNVSRLPQSVKQGITINDEAAENDNLKNASEMISDSISALEQAIQSMKSKINN